MLSAIILAAGVGSRLKISVPKPLVKICTKPVIIYSLEAFSRHPDIDEIIIVVSAQNKNAIVKAIKKHSFRKIKAFCLGGERRQDSVSKGLSAISQKSNWVLIHDSARPFISAKLITKVIRAAKNTGAAILGVPVKATIKSVKNDFLVDKTADRGKLWEIQTPQVFKKELILAAYNKYLKESFTDDAALVEKLDKRVKIVQGSYENIKITTKEDLLLAGLIAKRGADAI